jgi:transcriptional regulator with GAF, ATPase, and Fis domain
VEGCLHVLRSSIHFVRQFAERQGKCIDEIPDTLMDTLRQHRWPGNVRELQNVIERAVISTTGRTLQLPRACRRSDRPAASARTLAEVEREHIVATLQATNWVLGGWDGAAARLGLSRTTLISRMQRLGIAARNGAKHPSAVSGVAANGVRAAGHKHSASDESGPLNRACASTQSAREVSSHG